MVTNEKAGMWCERVEECAARAGWLVGRTAERREGRLARSSSRKLGRMTDKLGFGETLAILQEEAMEMDDGGMECGMEEDFCLERKDSGLSTISGLSEVDIEPYLTCTEELVAAEQGGETLAGHLYTSTAVSWASETKSL